MGDSKAQPTGGTEEDAIGWIIEQLMLKNIGENQAAFRLKSLLAEARKEAVKEYIADRNSKTIALGRDKLNTRYLETEASREEWLRKRNAAQGKE